MNISLEILVKLSVVIFIFCLFDMFFRILRFFYTIFTQIDQIEYKDNQYQVKDKPVVEGGFFDLIIKIPEMIKSIIFMIPKVTLMFLKLFPKLLFEMIPSIIKFILGLIQQIKTMVDMQSAVLKNAWGSDSEGAVLTIAIEPLKMAADVIGSIAGELSGLMG